MSAHSARRKQRIVDSWRRRFGQEPPPLIDYLKTVLLQYPDGGQILKELLQNANDAEATVVKFALDERCYGTDPSKLLDKNMAKYQGAALYAYNNELFKKEDWFGIQQPGRSWKKKKALKIGRFGIGFNSVYHVTDLPSIVSGEDVAFLDPLQCNLSGSVGQGVSAEAARPGETGELMPLNELLEDYPDQAAAYNVLSCETNSGQLHGTLFRFPLRQEESALSRTMYTPEKVCNQLFQPLREEASCILLFLNSVRQLEVHVWRHGQKTMQQILCVKETSKEDAKVFQQKMVEAIQRKGRGGAIGSQVVELNRRSCITVEDYGKMATQQWFIMHELGTNNKELQQLQLELDKDSSYHVWAAVAVPITEVPADSTLSSAQSIPWLLQLPQVTGHAFCFLPMPIKTGLPVHVHGYFAVSNNRRGIKWPSSEEHGKDALWNELLIKHTLANVYIKAMLQLWSGCHFRAPTPKMVESIDTVCCAVYAAWPDAEKFMSSGLETAPWVCLLQCVRPQLFKLPLLWSHSCDGRWLKVADAWLMQGATLATTALDVDGSLSRGVMQSVYEVMLALNEPVVLLPPHVWRTLHSEESSDCRLLLSNRSVQPSVVRHCLRNSNALSLQCAVEGAGILSALLEFLMHDLPPERITVELHGLNLLPTRAKTSKLQLASLGSNDLYIDTSSCPMQLVPGLEVQFIDTASGILSTSVTEKLRAAAHCRTSTLRMLDRDGVLQLLPISICVCYPGFRDASPVKWSPKDVLATSWLERVWCWLNTFCRDDLSCVEGLPLLPVQDKLFPLQHESTVLMPNPGQEKGVPCNVLQLLKGLGCQLIRPVPNYLQHRQLMKYVSSFSPDGVIKVICYLVKQRQSQAFEWIEKNATDEEKLSLLHFISLASDNLDKTTASALCCLPIFPTAGRQPKFVPLDDSAKLLPSGLPKQLVDVPVLSNMLMAPEENTQVACLICTLGCAQLTTEQLIVDVLVPYVMGSPGLCRLTILHFVASNMSSLSHHALQQLSKMEFVPAVGSPTLHCPLTLYDPSDETLAFLLYRREGVYPADMFKGTLPSLRKMGLKSLATMSRSEKAQLVKRYASSISQSTIIGKELDFNSACTMANNLMKFLVKAVELHNHKVMRWLQSISWLPATPRPSDDRYPPGLCWLGEEPLPTGELLYGTSNVVTTEAIQANPQIAGLLVGSTARLLPEELTSTVKQNRKLLESFSWATQDGASLAAEHLLSVTSLFKPKKSSSNEGTVLVKTRVHHVCTQIYSYLQPMLASSQAANAVHILKNEACLWNNDAGFLKPCHVVQTLPKGIVHLEPYHYAVEPAFRPFRMLFTEVGAKEQLTFADLRSVLIRVQDEIGSRYLSELQLQLCLSVLRCKEMSDGTTELNKEDSVLVPTANCKLLPAVECTYRDGMFWKASGNYAEDDDDFAEFNLVHPELSVQLAKAYKVQPLSTKVLPSDELNLEYEQVGQHEPLTTRLRNILCDYPNDMTVLKELIQNADDAGATEVKFMLDMRRATDNSCRKLLHEKMKAWQGPALWAYNNAVFTEDDFHNIMLLGGGTKCATPGKIGRFGLGFCSTYHLTDVPSFVSQDSIIFLDPHCTNLEGRVNPSQPGMRIKFTKQQKGLRAFRDQFSVYTDVFGCRVVGEDSHPATDYPHTLFRFPLRNGSQHSEISNNNAMQSCKILLLQLEEAAVELLLFLQHVRKVSIWQLADGARSPNEAHKLFTVFSGPAQHLLGDKRCSTLLSSLLDSYGKDIVKVMNGRHEEDLPWTSYRRTITMKSSKSDSVQEWVLSSSFGGPHSLQQVIELSQCSNEAFLLPWMGIACRIESKSKSVCVHPVDGRVFCFLPLPRSSGFPVHINGFFSVRSDRKSLDDEEGSNAPRVLWNHFLIRDVLPRAYVLLLKSLVILMEPCLRDLHTNIKGEVTRSLYNVLPGAQMPNTSYWLFAAKEVMKLCLNDQSVNILWTAANGGQWLSLHPDHKAILLGSQLRKYCEREAMEILIRLGQNVIHTSPGDGLLKSLEMAGISERFTMELFFRTVFFDNLERIDGELQDSLVDRLLKFMAQHEADSCCRSDWWCASGLRKHPCILSSDGRRQKPGHLIDLRPDNQHLLHLYDDSDGRFVHKRYTEHLHILRKWCCIISQADQLSVHDVMQCAESISSLALTDVEKAYKRAYHFVCFLEDSVHLSDMSLAGHLQKIPFLPVLSKPRDWLFPWAGNELFHNPAALLPQEWANAVGSTARIVDEERLQLIKCKRVYSFLKLQGKEPSLKQFVEQLQHISNVVASDRVAGPQTTLCVERIYRHLQEHVEELQCMCTLPKDWVWNAKHGQFMPVDRMSVSAPDWYGDLMPYHSTVGQKSEFVALFRHMGVKETISSHDLLNILQEIHTTSSARKQGLTKEELNMVFRLLDLLYKSKDVDKSTLLLPTNDGHLLPASECTYCDRQFLRKGSDELVGSEEAMQNRVHERVEPLAAKLGAVPLSRRLLPSEAFGLDYECVGQSEDLTTRLRNILSEYPGDSTILKELIQNADDAGAQKVCFVLDWRQHHSESLLNSAMKLWQGPALLAYNDAEFTATDFSNIMKLGGATKRQEHGKIGRFGLGFCSVYHLTDVPSFVSGDKIIFLDPHTTNLKDRVTRANPGMSINFVKSGSQLHNFADQFLPYDGVLGCCFDKHYPHTLFRLPLRQTCSERNLISGEIFNKKSMYKLLADFWQHLPRMLLFLQSVNEVIVYEVSEQAKSASEMNEIYHTCLSQPLQQYTAEGCGRDLLRQLSNKHKGELVSEMMRQAESGDSQLESILSMTVETKLTRYGKSCLAVKGGKKVETWLVSSCAGTRKAIEMCCSAKGRKEVLMPWAGCAVRLSVEGDGPRSIQPVDGNVFCFLPLPQNTGLPIHVNACFAVASNRRSLEDANDESLRVEWNRALVTDPLPQAYLKAILTLIRVVPITEQNRHMLHTLFPSASSAHHGFWKEMTDAFYEHLLELSSTPVLWSECSLSGSHWIPGGQAIFLVDHKKYRKKEMFDKAVGLAAACGHHAVEQPEGLKNILGGPHSKTCNVLTYREFCERVLHTGRGKEGFTDLFQFLLECEESDMQWCIGLLRTRDIVPTSAGTFVTALKLIDRNALHLSRLYADEDGRFPGHYLKGKHHEVLRSAGMAWKKIAVEDVLERAKLIGELYFDSLDLVRSRIEALFAYLAAPEADICKGSDEWNSLCQLQDVAFLPVLSNSDNDVFPLMGNDASIQGEPQPPSCLWPMKYLNMVGSKYLLVDETQLPQQFLHGSLPMNLLGLVDRVPSVETVIAHLCQVIKHVQHNASTIQGNVLYVMADIYKFLQDHLNEIIVDNLPECWVYVDGHVFVSPHHVTFESHPCGSLSPYRFVLDRHLCQTSKKLFLKIGRVREHLNAVNLIEVLHEIKQDVEQQNDGELSDAQFHMCSVILMYIKNNLDELKGSNLEILLPTGEKKLMPARTCTFCDQEFLIHTKSQSQLSKWGTPVHKDISSIAEALGAKSLSQVLLKPGQVNFKFDRRGQNEPLTTRLQNILRDYPEGLTVLKELVQNADDAGATEVRFLLDFRNHGTSSLFNDKMKDWQGPALWCFNDGAFTEKDFENIFKLAGATKQQEAGKIGRFGLGFCSVYNLSDVPSLVSCQKLVILDPHVENLGSYLADMENPGIIVDFVDQQDKMGVYVDQLEPYDGIFGCQMAVNGHQATPFPHTLFRFPLRNQTTAHQSKISKTVYDKEMILSLMAELQEEAEKLLLFLQAVKKISVYQLDSEACLAEEMHHLFSVEAKNVRSVSKESVRDSAVDRGLLKSLVSRGMLDSVSTSSPREITTCSMTISVHQEQPWSDTVEMPKSYEHHWVVCSCIGCAESESLSLARSSEGRKEGVMPWGGVAVQLNPGASEEECFLSSLDGRMFCFLPIPQQTNLPVHINGYFAVASSRRHIEDNTDGRFQTKWNRSLLGDPVPCAYLHALEGCLQQLEQTGLTSPSRLSNEVASFFPPLTQRGSLLDHLGVHFFEQLLQPNAPPLFWTAANGGKWLNASKAQFLHHTNFEEDHYDVAVSTLQDLGVAAVALPIIYKEEFKKFPHVINFTQFFTEHFFPNIQRLPQNVCVQFLKLLLDWRAQNQYHRNWCDQLISQSECVLASNGCLRRPSDLVHPRSNWNVLFTLEDGCFPASSAEFSSAHLAALVELGMALHMLRDDVIAERAHSVCTLSMEDGAKRAKELLHLLGSSWHRDPSQEASKYIKEELRSASFLPVAPKPDDYLLPWHGNVSNSTWTSANEAYFFKERWLVGSHACIIDDRYLQLSSSAPVSKLLGLSDKTVQCKIVLGQLSTILLTFAHCIEQSFLHTSSTKTSLSPHVPDTTDAERQFLNKATGRVYQRLNAFVGTAPSSSKSKEYRSIQEFLEGRAWIWQGDCFVVAEVMVFRTVLAELDGSRPFFNLVPSLLKDSCHNLLMTCGVVDTYGVGYYLKVMETLYHGYAGQRASKSHCKLLIKMAEIIDELRNQSGRLSSLHLKPNEVDVTRIVLPSIHQHLHYTTELSWYDTPWLPIEELDEDQITFVDDRVPFPLANAVGIKRGRHRLVESADIGEDFGQSEELVDRLSGILEKYPADVSILKELMQNADDAQATAIHFVLDTQTSYPTEKLFNKSDKWTELLRQPALCVFNNRPFSEEDINGISQLGRGSKRDDPLSTGRFGIGFNAVYHLTDCPSFLSRGQHGKPQDLCVFDPLLCYDPRATAGKPGRRYKLNEKKEKMFRDQFLPYLGDKLPEVKLAEEGSTVFRFPLRPNTFQGKTLPNGERWSTEEVLTLLLELREGGREMLLFLNHLQSLRVSVLNDGQLSTFYKVSREVSKSDTSLPALVGHRKPTVEQLIQGPCEVTFTMLLKEMNVKASKGLSIRALIETCKAGMDVSCAEQWLIHRSVGVEPHSTGIFEAHSIGRPNPAVDRDPFMYIRQATSTDKAVSKALDYGLLPRAGIAAPLQLAKSQSLTIREREPAGHAFCTLPTPIKSGLLPHIDGHFTLDDSRKELEIIPIFQRDEDEDLTDLRVQAWWNFWLLDHALVPAYSQWLLAARDQVEVIHGDASDYMNTKTSAEEATGRASPMSETEVALPDSDSDSEIPLPESDSDSELPLPDSDSDSEVPLPESDRSLSDSGTCVDKQIKSRAMAGTADHKHTVPTAEDTLRKSYDWYYALFPRQSECSDKFWKTLCRELYVYMARKEVCILVSQQLGTHVQWLPLAGKTCGIFHDHLGKLLLQLLLDVGLLLTSAPHILFTELREANIQYIQEVTPALVTKHLKSQCHEYVTRQSLGKAKATVDHVAELLRYCLKEWKVRSVGQSLHGTNAVDRQTLPLEDRRCVQLSMVLEGLPLLLTENKALRAFSCSDPVIITNFVRLLPNCTDELMNAELFEHIGTDLMNVALRNCTPCVVRALSVKRVAENLPQVWPFLDVHSPSPALWCSKDGDVDLQKWLYLLWKFLGEVDDPWKDVQEALGRFCVIPVASFKKTDKLQLLAARDIHIAICFGNYSNKDLAQAFWKLGLPCLAFDCLSTGSSNLSSSAIHKVSKATIELDNYKMITRGLFIVQSAGLQGDLTIVEARLILNHLAYLFWDSAIKLSYEERETLSMLRVFVSIGDSLVNLHGVKGFFQVQPGIPLDDCELWHNHQGIQVLKQMDEMVLNFITTILGKRHLSITDVYAEAILPQLLKMGQCAQLNHLYYIRDFVLPNCECEQRLINILQKTPFVSAQAGDKKHLPSNLFTPKNEVFEEFIATSFLLNDAWLDKKWHLFLKKLGLNTKLTRPFLLKFAKAVEKTSLATSHAVELPVVCPQEERVKTASRILLSSAKNIFSSLKSCISGQRRVLYHIPHPSVEEVKAAHAFIHNLREICFIFPADACQVGAMNLHCLLGDSNAANWLLRFLDGSKPVSFSGSGCYSECNLLWTQCSVLPSDLDWIDHALCGSDGLGLCSPPPLQMAINHLTAICQVLSQGSPLAKEDEERKQGRSYLHRCFVDIYNFLENYLEANSGHAGTIQMLRKVPCILVDDDHLLLPPTQVTQDDLFERLLPYLATLPSDFIRFQKLMTCVGVTKTPTAKQYAVVLEKLHDATEGKFFTVESKPNEFVKVRHASKELLALLQKEEEAAGTSSPRDRATKPKQQTASELEPLYLPANCIPESNRNNPMKYSCCRLVLSREVVFNNAFWMSRRIRHFDRILYILTQWKSGSEHQGIPSALGLRKLTEAVEEKIIPGLLADINCVWDSSSMGTPPSTVHSRIQRLYTLLTSTEFAEGVKRIMHHNGEDVKRHVKALNRVQQCKFVVVHKIKTVLYFKSVKENADVIEIPGSSESKTCHFLPKETLLIQQLDGDEIAEDFSKDIARMIFFLVVGHGKPFDEMYDLIDCTPENVHDKLDKRRVEQYGEMSDVQCKERDPSLGCEVPRDLLDLADDPTMPFSVREYAVYQIPGREPDCYILVRIVKELTTSEEAAKGPLHRRFLIEMDMEGSQEEVSVTDLFKFPTADALSAPESDDRQVVVSSGSSSEHRSSGPPDQTLEDAIREIRKQVRDAFQLSEADRKKVIKRLWLKWHPDKNDPAKKDLYTKAFQFLKNECAHWEKYGRGSPEEESASRCDPSSSASQQSQSHWRARDDEFEGGLGGYFRPSGTAHGGFGGNWGRSSRNYRQRHRAWRTKNSSTSSASFKTTSRLEAQRWLDQAESDLAFVQRHVQEGTTPSNAQACFMAQQVVEKALKAALYASSQGISLDLLPKHDVCHLAVEFQIVCPGCLSVTDSAKVVSNYYQPTRYPNFVSQPYLPCDKYSNEDAQKALFACTQVLDEVRSFIRRRQTSV